MILDYQTKDYTRYYKVTGFQSCALPFYFRPDVIHANDWHTGPAVYRLAMAARADPFFAETASLYTIHNLPYTGRGAGPYLAQYGLAASPALATLPDSPRASVLWLGIAGAYMLTAVIT